MFHVVSILTVMFSHENPECCFAKDTATDGSKSAPPKRSAMMGNKPYKLGDAARLELWLCTYIYYIISYYIILYYIILYHIVLNYIILYYILY